MKKNNHIFLPHIMKLLLITISKESFLDDCEFFNEGV